MGDAERKMQSAHLYNESFFWGVVYGKNLHLQQASWWAKYFQTHFPLTLHAILGGKYYYAPPPGTETQGIGDMA